MYHETINLVGKHVTLLVQLGKSYNTYSGKIKYIDKEDIVLVHHDIEDLEDNHGNNAASRITRQQITEEDEDSVFNRAHVIHLDIFHRKDEKEL